MRRSTSAKTAAAASQHARQYECPPLPQKGRGRLNPRRPIGLDVGDRGEGVHPHRPEPSAGERRGRWMGSRNSSVGGRSREDVQPIRDGIRDRRGLEPQRRRGVLRGEQKEPREVRPRDSRGECERHDSEEPREGDDAGHDGVTAPPCLPPVFLRVLGVDVRVEHVVDAVEEDVRREEKVAEQPESRHGEQPCGGVDTEGDRNGDRAGEIEPKPRPRQRQQIPESP